MHFSAPLLALTVAAVATVAQTSAQSCPPAGFTSKLNLNPSVYFAGAGFTLKMVTVGNPAPVFCDFGELSHTTNATDGTIRPRVVISSNSVSVSGPRTGLALNGKIPDPKKPGQTMLSLGPNNIPYWVIEAGSFEDLLAGKTTFTSEKYDWVITATGGPPTTKTAGGCLPPAGMALRIVSTKPKVSAEVETKLLALAKSKGYDVSALVTIPHEGCTYK
jgi:hypothetical protein